MEAASGSGRTPHACRLLAGGRVVTPDGVLSPGWIRLAGDVIDAVGTGGNLTSDAHVAAIAIEHGAAVATFDADFHRFGDLRLDYLRP